jgi:hypothetical protein
MAKQIEFVLVVLKMERQGDGSYVNVIQEVAGAVKDPAAATYPDKELIQFPVTGVAYNGAATLNAFLDTCLAEANTKAGI